MTNPPSEFPVPPSQPGSEGAAAPIPPQNVQPPAAPQPPVPPLPPVPPQYAPVQQPMGAPVGGPPAGMPPAPPQYAPAPQQPPSGPATPKGLAIAALIIGIVALVTAWVPVLGLILGVVGLILGIIAVVKKQPKGLGLTGLILSIVAIIVSLVVSIIGAVALFTLGAAVDEMETTPTQTQSPSTPSEETPGTDEPTGDEFPEVSAAELAEIAADPNAWIGTKLTVYGTVLQFDEGTGMCSMRLYISNSPQTDPANYEHNTLAYAGDWDADCPGLEVFAVGDNVVMAAEVMGEEVYSTSDGAEVSAIQVDIWELNTL